MQVNLVSVLIVAAVLPFSGILGKTIPEDQFSLRADQPVVTISDGHIIGTVGETVNKRVAYNAFKGIPFAQPPVGNLRFASPVKNERWSGYLDATQDCNVCIQGSGDEVTGSEDCLCVNVYVPRNAQNLSVMVWIYGGAFMSGDSRYESFAPDFILDDGVAFVSFNYRLGMFGFMSTEDTTVSGNFGLKDQVLALEWVRDNIEAFGGNPNRVTIFGESAGGALVSYLLQIPKAHGLFHAAIVQSGTSENLWALTTRARTSAFQVGYSLGIAALLARTLVDRLRQFDAYEIQRTASSVANQQFILNPLRGLVWAPTIEAPGPDAVFAVRSDEYFRTGLYPNKVPILIGHTSNEAGHAHGLAETLRQLLILFDISSTNLAPYSLTSTSQVRNLVANEVKLNFWGLNSISSQLYETIEFINVDQFTRATIRVALNVAQYVPVYFYNFGYIGDITGDNPYDGAGHAEELCYIFRQLTGTYSANDLIVSSKLVRVWTNFAKYFNPTPTREALLDNVIWPRVDVTSSDLPYVWLNLSLSTDINPGIEHYNFYQNLFDLHGNAPYTTY